jgi:metal-responsive CopG/Arc/MetJ family transcriptional regulator
MKETNNKINSTRVTVDLPKDLVTLVDKACKLSLSTRRKWFFDAMTLKLTQDGLLKKK